MLLGLQRLAKLFASRFIQSAYILKSLCCETCRSIKKRMLLQKLFSTIMLPLQKMQPILWGLCILVQSSYIYRPWSFFSFICQVISWSNYLQLSKSCFWWWEVIKNFRWPIFHTLGSFFLLQNGFYISFSYIRIDNNIELGQYCSLSRIWTRI